MSKVHLVMLVASLVCFILAAFNAGGKYNLVAVGLALWVATLIF